MEVITAAVFSTFICDMLKHQVSLNVKNLKLQLQGWLVDETVATKIVGEIQELGLTHGMSESVITAQLNASAEILLLIQSIKPATTTITQSHQGCGDNIAGNKVIHYR